MVRDKSDGKLTKILWQSKSCILGKPIGFNKYALTKNNIVVQKGILKSKCIYINITDIIDVQLQCSIWDRLFGVGSIIVISRDVGAKECILTKVPSASKLALVLEEMVSRNKQEMIKRSYTVNRNMQAYSESACTGNNLESHEKFLDDNY